MSCDMNELTELIKTESNTEETVSKIVSDLQGGSLSILQLIEKLGGLLTSHELGLRKGGLEILSDVLQSLSSSYITAKELEHLVGYYTNSLADHHSLTPAVLRGFLALANMANLTDGMASKVFTVLNLNFTCQSQLQGDRFIYYQILNTLMEQNPKALQALGPDFVCGYLSAIDSERDPRNLMYLFDRLPNFFKNFPPGHLLEDAFETVSCYFPVDFRSNPNDPRGISREDLSKALMPCLLAIDDFCPLTVALALDKLSSDLKVAKIDSLLLLRQGFDAFSPEKLCPLIEEVASTLLSQLKPGVIEADVQDLCIDVFVSLMKYLSKHEKIDILKTTVADAFKNVEYFLNDFRGEFFTPAVKFLARAALSCNYVCTYIITMMIPKLLSIQSSSDSDQILILESLKVLLVSCSTFDLNMIEVVPVWPRVVEFFLSLGRSENTKLKVLAIEGMTNVARLFSMEERKALYSILGQNIKLERDSLIRQKSIDCLRINAIHFPEELQESLNVQFALFENGSPVDAELKKRVFECWCHLASVPGFVIYLDQAIKNYIVEDKLDYAEFVIEVLKDMVIREKENISFLRTLHYDINVTRSLIDWWHKGCDAVADGRSQVFEDEHAAENLEIIICIIIRVLDEKLQLEIAIHYLKLTIENSKRFMNSFQYLNETDNLNSPEVHCSLSIITFESIVNALLPSALQKTLSECFSQIVKYLSTLAVYCSRPICCTMACRSIATIFNKMNEGRYLDEQIEYLFVSTSTLMKNKAGQLQKNATNLMVFITKSLLLRSYHDLNKWLDQLLFFITNEDVNDTIACGFRDICREDEYFLNPTCHCSVKLFYRQRLFLYVIAKLVTIAKTAVEGVKIQCAVSAVYILDNLPQSIVARYFNEIVPLLVDVLNKTCKTDILLIAIQKLYSLLQTDGAIFEDHIETFLPKFISLAQNAESMKVRIAALECVAEYSNLKPMIILPHRTRVVHSLISCVDDRKRLVRKTAVKARNRWIVLGNL